MTHHILDAVIWSMVLSGVFFIISGAVGVLRLPDFYTRLHAQGKCDTLGVALMLGGLAVRELAHGLESGHGLEGTLTALKIVAIVFFVMLANPTATHALGRSALRAGLKPWTLGEKEGKP